MNRIKLLLVLLLAASCTDQALIPVDAPATSDRVIPKIELSPHSSLILSVTTSADLISAINEANTTSSTVIDLSPGATYTLTETNNIGAETGINGLPILNSSLVINGNGATIEREGESPEFRFFYVSSTAELTLNDLTPAAGPHAGGFCCCAYRLSECTPPDHRHNQILRLFSARPPVSGSHRRIILSRTHI